ncbi:hypothetical protein [Corynebacterium sp.]|uniref:hypothetical protein n=1 Tax=Corynebacterium sp. TaxID=1720 RepID=UPI0026DC1371|nr:hypothetical protein [Corynebacterium sp.]MDO5075777.1 hypothetical protein [Corynebacterium sp.]
MRSDCFVFFEPDYAPNGTVQVSSLHLPESLLAPRLQRPPATDNAITKAFYSISPNLQPEILGDRCIQVRCNDTDGLVEFAVIHKLGLAHIDGQRILMFGDESATFSSETGSWFLPVAPRAGLLETLRYAESHLAASRNDFLVIRNLSTDDTFVQARPRGDGSWLIEYRNGHQDRHFQLTVPNVRWVAGLMELWMSRDPRFLQQAWTKVGYDFLLFQPDPRHPIGSLNFMETPLAARYHARPATSQFLNAVLRGLTTRVSAIPGISLFDAPRITGDRCIQVTVAQSSAPKMLPFLLEFAAKNELGLLDLFRHLVLLFGDEDCRVEVSTPEWKLPGVSFAGLTALLHAATQGLFNHKPSFEFRIKESGNLVTAEYETGFWVLRMGRQVIEVKEPPEAAKMIKAWCAPEPARKERARRG